MKQIISILLLSLSILANSQNDVLHIDLTSTTPQEVKMSDLFDKVEYVKLETTKDCLLKPSCTFYFNDKYIIALNIFYDTYVFDRKTGKFIRKLGQKGQGPEEFCRFMEYDNGFDEENQIVYAYDITSWKGYDIRTGKMTARIKSPFDGKETAKRAVSPWNLGNGKYISCISDPAEGKEHAIIFNKDGKIEKTFYQDIWYDPAYFNRDDYPGTNGSFYRLDGKLYMTQKWLRNISYEVSNDKLLPHIIMHTGNKSYTKSVDDNQMGNRINFHFVRETQRFVFFTYIFGHDARNRYSGCFDKKLKKTCLATRSKEEKYSGFKNDIDGLLSFYPQYINNAQEIIGKILPEELLSYMDKYGANCFSPRAKKLVAGVQEDDNPIVVIATPKK